MTRKMFASDNNATILNALYPGRFPQAIIDNLKNVNNPLSELSITPNEFLSDLINRIGKTIFKNQVSHNRLSVFRKENMPFGDQVQDIAMPFIKGHVFDVEGKGFADRIQQKVSVIYHKFNVRIQYSGTTQDINLRQAFINEGGLSTIMNMIVQALSVALIHDQFLLSKELFRQMVSDKPQILGTKTIVNITGDTLSEVAKDLFKKVKDYGEALTFVSTDFNGSKLELLTDYVNQNVIMHRRATQILETETLLDVANPANLNLPQNVIRTDNFNADETGILAVLVDGQGVEIRNATNDLFETFRNPKGHFTNYFLTNTSGYSYSSHHNFVAFKLDENVSEEIRAHFTTDNRSLSKTLKTALENGVQDHAGNDF